MTAEQVHVSPAWLALREAADAAARAPDLVEQLRRHLPAGRPLVVHDLGSGTGSMGRWLAPQLDLAQHWILYDLDPGLLAQAVADPPGPASDRPAVTLETRLLDVTRLNPGQLVGASLVTASALLDMLTEDELERFVTACAGAGGPVLVTLSVIGRVDLAPAEPWDGRIRAAFNEHQRRVTCGRRLLGPDAAGVAVAAFRRLGADVLVRPSLWRLGAAQAALAGQWLTGWVGAACEQRPELADEGAAYVRRRLAQIAAGQLAVTVHHHDLLVRPR